MEEIITLPEIKAYLRLGSGNMENDPLDAVLRLLRSAAVEEAVKWTGLSVNSQTITQRFNVPLRYRYETGGMRSAIYPRQKPLLLRLKAKPKADVDLSFGGKHMRVKPVGVAVSVPQEILCCPCGKDDGNIIAVYEIDGFLGKSAAVKLGILKLIAFYFGNSGETKAKDAVRLSGAAELWASA